MASNLDQKKELFATVRAPEDLARDPKVVLKPCVLCGARLARRLYMQAHFPVLRCECGLVYADEHFEDADLARFYSGDYYQRAYVCHPPEIDAKIADDYVRAFDPIDRELQGGRLLDFGSARGTFLRELRSRGYGERWSLEGLDINPDEAAMGVAAGLEIHCGTLSSSGLAPESFDVVTAYSVLEHLQDPLAEVRGIARLLRPGGRLLAIVPAGDCLIIALALLASRIAPRRSRHFTDNVFHEEHLYYFTRQTMTRLLAAAGFSVRRFFAQPSYLETHPPSAGIAIGAYGLRLASFLSRRQTRLGVEAVREPRESRATPSTGGVRSTNSDVS